jgi:outer membrane protein assembly factor BamB
MRMNPITATLAACVASLSTAMAADVASLDWPCWRGTKRDGMSADTGLLKEWPAGGPKLAWKISGLGGGYSSVAVAGGKIFTMGDGRDGCVLIAMDAKDGKQLWTSPVGAPGGNYPGPRGTPAVDGPVVYALGQHGDLVCVEIASGKTVWKKSLAKDFGGKIHSGWGFAESPLIDGDFLVVTPGSAKGTIAKLNKKTGEPVWFSKDITDPAAYSSLIVEDFGGVRQYMQLTASNVVGVSAKDGSVLWKAPRSGKTAVIPTPVFHDGVLFVTSGYGVGCNAFKITPKNGAFTAEQIYASPDLQNHHGGVIRVGEYVYGHSDSGGLTCMEMKTGKVMWKNPSVGKGALTFADGNLILRSEGGKGSVALIEASPEGYKEKGRFDQPDRAKENSWPHPVVSNGKLYLRDQGVLLCYDVKGN